MMQESADLKEELIEKIADLPQEQLQEVLDFVSFLKSKKLKTEDPVLDVAGCLSGAPLSAKEIEEELYGNESA